jgi:ABC-type iron transport system FetAB ATPase subunit
MRYEYEAVRHVLTAPHIARRTAAFITADDFDFAGLAREAETMSGGESVLVRVARTLWLAEPAAGLWEIVRRLDAASFDRVAEALRIARGEYAWSAVEAYLERAA